MRVRWGRSVVMSCPLSAVDGGDYLAAARRLAQSPTPPVHAIRCYRRALSLHPDPNVHYEVAAVAYGMGDSEELEHSMANAAAKAGAKPTASTLGREGVGRQF